jgi:hypothetical protein
MVLTIRLGSHKALGGEADGANSTFVLLPLAFVAWRTFVLGKPGEYD